ncbi:WD40/YVTN/BNR-like repeat-containing protein [Gemmatimonadota bacterium]
MSLRRVLSACSVLLVILLAGSAPRDAYPLSPQGPQSSPFSEMHWRSIGPFRGGRCKAIEGVPGRPHVFYMGVVNGGVWKTDDAGRTWEPIFDDQPTGSIGDIAVAPSAPDVVYVGSGEGLHRPDLSVGDGIYKSTDGGETWTHLGLRDGQQIPRIAVDPRDPDRLFVAVLGHPYGPNEERGVFLSTNGGRSFEKVLYIDENTGASDVDIDPANPNVVYACLWEDREGPWENANWSGKKGGIFKSTDGGAHWRKLAGGLPEGENGVEQADLVIAPSNPNRLYATVAMGRGVGIFRSDDAGETWTRITQDSRPAGRIGGGDLPVPAVDPKNPDIVYSASVVMWRSTDGGRTWTAIRGAPGGDDYQRIWINPDNPDIIATAADQGTVISLNGGKTWSSWYNQPTAQLYHVAADNAFPYNLYSGQQESGSAGIASRGNDGQITFREWHPVGVDEYGYAAPDPLDPNIVYGGRRVTRYDKRTGRRETVGPTPPGGGRVRTVRTAPVLFSPVDPHVLYFAGDTLWKTMDGGETWEQISPVLSRETYETPASVGTYRDQESAQPARRGVIYTVAPSYVDVNTIWAGTDDGLIHVTHDGGRTWQNVTPPDLMPWAKVSLMDAGHSDTMTAYAAINTIRIDDMRPHIYRTHDGGRTWTHITNGIPDGGTINAVREDPERPGLLFAGSEQAVYVSFDDGDHWQSLRLDMAASSVRDLIIKDDDLVAATHGRGFWILDDITPLRQWGLAVTGADAYFFRPQRATRVVWNMNTDTPLPPDEPAGENPPDGAVLHYWLRSDVPGPVTLEILDATGTVVRTFSSDDPVPEVDPNLSVPTYWLRPPQSISRQAGLHRFVWDLYYEARQGGGGRGGTRLPIAAIAHNTVPTPNAPRAEPGTYTVRLTVGGRSYTEPLVLREDPRLVSP